MTVKQLLDVFHKGMYQSGGNIRHDMNVYFRDNKGELKEIAASRSGRLKASHIIREALDEKIEREKKAKR